MNSSESKVRGVSLFECPPSFEVAWSGDASPSTPRISTIEVEGDVVVMASVGVTAGLISCEIPDRSTGGSVGKPLCGWSGVVDGAGVLGGWSSEAKLEAECVPAATDAHENALSVEVGVVFVGGVGATAGGGGRCIVVAS